MHRQLNNLIIVFRDDNKSLWRFYHYVLHRECYFCLPEGAINMKQMKWYETAILQKSISYKKQLTEY